MAPGFFTKLVRSPQQNNYTNNNDASGDRSDTDNSLLDSSLTLPYTPRRRSISSSSKTPLALDKPSQPVDTQVVQLNLPDDSDGPDSSVITIIPPSAGPGSVLFPTTVPDASQLLEIPEEAQPVIRKRRSILSLLSRDTSEGQQVTEPVRRDRRALSFSSSGRKSSRPPPIIASAQQDPSIVVVDSVTPSTATGAQPSAPTSTASLLSPLDSPSSKTAQPMLHPSSAAPEKTLTRKSSSKSIRSQANEPPAPSVHPRSATTPNLLNNDKNSIKSPPISPDSAITSSPEELKPVSLIGSPDPESTTFVLPPPYDSTLGQSSTTLSARTDTDVASVRSASLKSPKKKRGWGRSEPQPKLTGLAGAIAASGMAMANPTINVNVSPIQSQRSIKEKPKAEQKGASPRKSSRSSKSSRKGTSPTSSVRPHSSQLSLQPMQSSASLEIYDSASSRSISESPRSDDEFLEEDMPVTGFAVASSKRNADFHDLFKNIPEGDYLIEDYGCAIQREILVQGRLYISENHICFHANIFGWITDLSIPIFEITTLEKKMTALIIPNAIQITTRQAKYTFSSFLSRDTTFDVIYNIWRLARPQDTVYGAVSGSSGSLDALSRVGTESVAAGSIMDKVPLHKITSCACSKASAHFSETALESVLPGTPDRIHNLMFASGFLKDFMREDLKLLDIQMSDWTPETEGSKLLSRNMSYIKPLNGAVGPKQTKCESKDEVVYCNVDDYITTVTTTRTPDVPSGGVFSVKTRTCITWASSISSRVVVTTQVEWTGRSFIKGIIERSAIDGQRSHHLELDNAMRKYIQEHQSEFIPEGVDPAAVAPVEPSTAGLEPPGTSKPLSELEREREHDRNRRGLQWAWDTFEDASQVARRSTNGALELIRDAWDQSTSTTILYFVIVVLVISNLWTLMIMGNREEVGRRKEMQRMEERERWVQGVVKGLWEEMASGKVPSVPGMPFNAGEGENPLGNIQDELASIQKTLDAVEERVRIIRGSLVNLD